MGNVINVLFMSVGLSMDAFAVAISDLFAYRGMTRKRIFLIPVVFALVQGGLLLAGFFAGHLLPAGLDKHAGLASFVILGIIGGKMVWDSFHEDPQSGSKKALSVPMLLFQAVATSLDALFIGVSFAMEGDNIVVSCAIITVVTLLVALVAVIVGKHLGAKFGEKLGQRATFFGGLVLIAIGVVELF